MSDTRPPRQALSATEIRRRLEFVGLSEALEDRVIAGRLSDLTTLFRTHADRLVAEFYQHLESFDELEVYLGGEGRRTTLRGHFLHYLSSFGAGLAQPEYFEQRSRIGLVHERIGLDESWYLLAMSRLFEILAGLLKEAWQPRSDLPDALILIQRVLALDTLLAVESWHQAREERLVNVLRRSEELRAEIEEAAQSDALTGAATRRHLMSTLEAERRRAALTKTPFSLLMIDIDRFKSINDEHGHLFGDEVLRGITAVAREVLRPGDIIGRFGGDEFVVGLRACDSDKAEAIGDRIRGQIAERPFRLDDHEVSVTVSVGVVSVEPGDPSVEAALARADQALYSAKHEGRNRTRRVRRPS